MDKEISGELLYIKYPVQWKFISSQHTRETIDSIIAKQVSERKSTPSELELNADNLTLEECYIYTLCNLAHKKLWTKITKEQVHALLKAIFVISILKYFG